MSYLEKLISSACNVKEYLHKLKFLSIIIAYVQSTDNRLPANQAECAKKFVIDELKALLPDVKSAIENNTDFKKRDLMFSYKNGLVELFVRSNRGWENLTSEESDIIGEINRIVDKETLVENAVVKMFDHSIVVKSDVDTMIETLRDVTDTYRIGVMFTGLFHFRDRFLKFDRDAIVTLADYVVKQTDDLLARDVDDDVLVALEFVADICVYLPTDNVKSLLRRLLISPYNRPRFYALDSLLSLGEQVDNAPEVVAELAQDVALAKQTYKMLKKHNRLELYPPEYADEEYLAKSDLIQWLLYPSELNKFPDKIERLGTIKVKKEKYYIYKYQTDSENLPDDFKNQWLIGWSNENGGTFSVFAKLSDYEKSTPEKTLKNIANKLIKCGATAFNIK